MKTKKQVFTSSLISPASYLKSKFTLIELLVVIAIIAILAGMLLPALGKTKQTAMNTTCINQVKQMLVAAKNYASTYNETYMKCMMPGPNGSMSDYTAGSGYMTWDGALLQYLKGGGIVYGDYGAGYNKYTETYFSCPRQGVATSLSYVHYGWNKYLFGSKWGDAYPFIQDGAIKGPSTSLMIGEVHGKAGCSSGIGFFQVESACFRHRQKQNAGYCDGHVEAGDIDWIARRKYGNYPINEKNLVGTKDANAWAYGTTLAFTCWNKGK